MACLDTCLRIISGIPVVVVAILSGGVYYLYVVHVCGFILAFSPATSICLLVFFHVLFLTYIYAYYKTVSTNPGSPKTHPQPTPLAYQTDASSDGASIPLQPRSSSLPLSNGGHVTVKRDGRPRFCTKCQLPKPDRAHHCSSCDRCVLKMDHHCPWVNNCIGFYNQKYFILFVLYGGLASLFVFVTSLVTMMTMRDEIASVELAWVICIIAGFVFGLSLLVFSGLHINFVLRNLTTIESWERFRYVRDDGRVVLSHQNAFNIGWRKNWQSVMGSNPWLWFLPVMNSEGDGYTFPFNSQSLENIV